MVNATHDRILKRFGDNVNPSRIPEQHRTVLLVLHAHGIIGNGGFQYLFEGDFPGDPEYLLTRQAYKTIGATRACTAFQKAFAVFRKSTPPKDIERRLEMWGAKYTLMDAFEGDDSPDAMYFNSMEETNQLLESYIRKNLAAFDSES
jgi:hypothetical protein